MCLIAPIKKKGHGREGRRLSLMFDLLFHEDQSSLCGKMIIFVQSENGTSKIIWLYGFKKKKRFLNLPLLYTGDQQL